MAYGWQSEEEEREGEGKRRGRTELSGRGRAVVVERRRVREAKRMLGFILKGDYVKREG